MALGVEKASGWIIPAVEVDALAEVMRWNKSADKLISALCAAPHGHEHGFLYETDGGYAIKNWEFYTLHCYQWLAKKEYNRDRNRRIRNTDPENVVTTVVTTLSQHNDNSCRDVVTTLFPNPTVTQPTRNNGLGQRDIARKAGESVELSTGLSTGYPQEERYVTINGIKVVGTEGQLLMAQEYLSNWRGGPPQWGGRP
ncbi:hypothetical protein AGMMS49992_26010 [Clostridia bacterium]|nr:hypothetical protein AGMMS49992_26010 [Clostridia bacterium]